MSKVKLLSLVSSFSFGGLVGMAVASLVYKAYPSFFSGLVEPKWLIIYGGLVGGSIHSAIAYVLNWIFSPVFRFIVDIEKLLEAYVLYKLRIIDDQKLKELINHRINERFGIPDKEQKALESKEKADSVISKLAEKILQKLNDDNGKG